MAGAPDPDATSFDSTAYARTAAAAVGLSLPEDSIAAVAANLARLAQMAETLRDFPTPAPNDAQR